MFEKLRKIRYYIAAAILVIIGITALFSKLIVPGLIIVGIGFLIFSLWEFLLKEREEKIDTLIGEIQAMKSENKSLRDDIRSLSERKLNISEINTILDLGLLEVDTNFKRTVNKNFTVEGKQVQFIGVLNVNLKAKYGIDIRKLKFRVDEANSEIYVLNAEPRFLSFSKRNLNWEIDQILEYNAPFLGMNRWQTNPKLDQLAGQIREEIRIATEKETENGPQELNWIIIPLRKHVEAALELIVGMRGYKIRMADSDDGGFRPVTEILQSPGNKKLSQRNEDSDETTSM